MRNLPLVFKIVSVVVPFCLVIGLPRLLQLVPGYRPIHPSILWLAGLIFFVSWYLPSPLVQGKDTAFLTHFLGGGVFTALVASYIGKSLQLKLTLWQELVAVFFFVSGLGVANELFELFTVQVGLSRIDPSDTWWDLVANTLGATFCVLVMRSVSWLRRR